MLEWVEKGIFEDAKGIYTCSWRTHGAKMSERKWRRIASFPPCVTVRIALVRFESLSSSSGPERDVLPTQEYQKRGTYYGFRSSADRLYHARLTKVIHIHEMFDR